MLRKRTPRKTCRTIHENSLKLFKGKRNKVKLQEKQKNGNNDEEVNGRSSYPQTKSDYISEYVCIVELRRLSNF